MNLLSTLFLASLTAAISNHFTREFSDLPREYAPVTIDYQSQTISFTARPWTIDLDSVCANTPPANFSRCSAAAKAFFVETCMELIRESESGQQIQVRAMFCEAARSYSQRPQGRIEAVEGAPPPPPAAQNTGRPPPKNFF
ncbi:MAG: hypothetical protein ACFCBW_07600 [Candidatus Competibacterales bacterium]